jgi:hypothetical protein
MHLITRYSVLYASCSLQFNLDALL